MKIIKITVLSFISSILLVGCSNDNLDGGSGPHERNKDGMHLYLDDAKIDIDNLNIEFNGLYDNEFSDNHRVSLNIKVKNVSTKSQTVGFSKAIIVRESNKAEYSVSGLFSYKQSLESEITENYIAHSELPTSFEDDKYMFKVSINSNDIAFHMYATPDEYREKCDVDVYLNGTFEETVKVPKGRRFIDYEWHSKDYVYGSQHWYSDADLTKAILSSTIVNEKMAIYGSKQSILKYLPEYNFISGYNFIPQNGELVIPKALNGNSITYVQENAFGSDIHELRKLYIPNNLKIGKDNFTYCTNLKFVYFEGTEEEWSSLNSSSFPFSTNFVFNTYK